MTIEPRVERPYMPDYGIAQDDDGLLPWRWAVERLEQAREYWIATTSRADGPHLAAVWGVWLDGWLAFSTGGRSRKARDLAAEPRCAFSTASASESVVVEGVAERVATAAVLSRLLDAYLAKYGEGFPDPAANPVFSVRPSVAFGIIDREPEFSRCATRWSFDKVDRGEPRPAVDP